MRRSARFLMFLALALAMTASPAHAATPTRAAASTPPARSLGVVTVGTPGDLSEVSSLATRTGTRFDQVTWYVAWSGNADFPAADAARVKGMGAVPEITWEPWDPARGIDQPTYALRRIASGAFDSYVSRWAKQVKAYGGPVVLRFAHEMNGSWYPWAEQVNGNSPGDYVAAWRHVVGVFARAKVTNVTWSWSPNLPYPGATALTSLYPGDSYVGRVGLDGYNWGTSQPWSTWQSPAELFGPGVAELTALTAKPIHLEETASSELGGDKAAWISDLWTWLGQHPEVRGLTWFSLAKETDWRIDSSAGTLAAYAAGASAFRTS